MQLKKKQRGMTFVGLVMTAILIVMAGMVVVQVIPTYIEYLTVQKAVQKSAGGTTVNEVRTIFDKAASVDAISSITGSNLVVGKEANRVVVAFAYAKEIHLVGPAYLVMKYEGKSK